MCAHECVCVCMSGCSCVCVCVCVSECVSVSVCFCLSVSVCYECISVCMCLCLSMCVCVCGFLCVGVYVFVCSCVQRVSESVGVSVFFGFGHINHHVSLFLSKLGNFLWDTRYNIYFQECERQLPLVEWKLKGLDEDIALTLNWNDLSPTLKEAYRVRFDKVKHLRSIVIGIGKFTVLQLPGWWKARMAHF